MQKEKLGQNKAHSAPLIERIEVQKIASDSNFNSNPPIKQKSFESSFVFLFENL